MGYKYLIFRHHEHLSELYTVLTANGPPWPPIKFSVFRLVLRFCTRILLYAYGEFESSSGHATHFYSVYLFCPFNQNIF